ncbi:MAG TPA: hypothetical protein VGQ99_09715 [Tepidisphaeraceae bacterium]|jgi:hypothetical protein|nr:hypothetical protein [Tepidisphaeraceae bacterium]
MLKRSDQKKLTEALDRLPAEVEFLRGVILAISKQDQDLLGCGEADVTELEKALHEQGWGEDLGSRASEAAEGLREWAQKQADYEREWAGPIWFAEAFLRGFELFNVTAMPPARPKPVLGLRRTEMEFPKGMKVKLYAGGLELKNREARIIIGEQDEGFYQAALEGYAREWPANLPRPPHLREERNMIFRIGKASGIKVASFYIQSGLAVMINYLLRLDGVNLQIGIFANGKFGADLEKYEKMIGTIRAKAGGPE